MKNAMQTEGSIFSVEQVIHIYVDFFFPSVSAVQATLSFTLQLLITYPEVLARCQKEIDEVVGKGRLPSLDDRIK